MNEKFTKEDILKIKNEELILIKNKQHVLNKFKVVRLNDEDEDSFYDVYLIEGGLINVRLENDDGTFRDFLEGRKETLDMTGFAEDVAYYLNEYLNLNH